MAETSDDRIAKLWRMYRARKVMSGYKTNVEQIVNELRAAGETVEDYE